MPFSSTWVERRLTLDVETSLRDTVAFLGMATVAFVPGRRPSDHVSFKFQIPEGTAVLVCPELSDAKSPSIDEDTVKRLDHLPRVVRRRVTNNWSIMFELPNEAREVRCSRSYIGQFGFSSFVADFLLPFSRHWYHDRGTIMPLEKLIHLPVGRRRRGSYKKRWFYSSFCSAFRSWHLST